MVKVYSIDGITPVVHPEAYVHPSAVLIGDVIVGPRLSARRRACAIWPHRHRTGQISRTAAWCTASRLGHGDRGGRAHRPSDVHGTHLLQRARHHAV
jgi:hypothetical protein